MDSYKEYIEMLKQHFVVEDNKAKAIMKNIAEGFDSRGHFLEKFARMFVAASEANQECLLPAAHKLIEKYELERTQRERGILTDLHYQ